MRATTLFNLQCNNVALQVAAICCSYYFTLSNICAVLCRRVVVPNLNHRNNGQGWGGWNDFCQIVSFVSTSKARLHLLHVLCMNCEFYCVTECDLKSLNMHGLYIFSCDYQHTMRFTIATYAGQSRTRTLSRANKCRVVLLRLLEMRFLTKNLKKINN